MVTSTNIVAIVDDDVVVRDSIKFLLETFGFFVETFSSANEFLRQFQCTHKRFRCLIVDHLMPDITGLDLVSRLQADGHSISTMLITAALTPEVARIAAEIGIKKVVEKPAEHRDLVAFASIPEGS
jgi:FixJ family two-component response regulator